MVNKTTLTAILVAVVVLMAVQQAEQVSFDDFCYDLRTYEKAFNGECSLIDQNVYLNMMSMVAFVGGVAESTPDKSVHDLLAENFFTQSLAYFREKYKDQADYMTAVDKLVDELQKLLGALKSSEALSSTMMKQLYAPFETSGFSVIARKVIDQTNQAVNEALDALPSNATSEDFSLVRLNFTCANDNNFCGNTQRIFGLSNLDLLADVSVKQFLLDSNKKLYDNLNRIQYLNQFETVNTFINDWDKEGIEKTTVSQLYKILDTNYMRAGFYVYEQENKRTTVRKTRSTTTTVILTTTKEVKVTNETAVSEVVYIVTPSLMIVFGAFGAFLCAYFFYKLKPIQVHFPTVGNSESAAMEKYTRQQDIELNKVNEKHVIRF